MTRLTGHNVRDLTAEQLGRVVAVGPAPVEPVNTFTDMMLPDDDPMLLRVMELLDFYGGVIFSGPPGTSKTYYAKRIAYSLTDGDPDRVRFVQFHPSYQYEDFVQGYVPKADGSGFELKPKHLMELCALAEADPDMPVVLVIDELSRGEPGRIFGEALTYVERSKRAETFRLSSGDELSIPSNLVFLATMNPQDRGVDEVDAAFERRFARIAMEPDVGLLGEFLTAADMDDELQDRVAGFFDVVQDNARLYPLAAVGHTFFVGAKDVDDLVRVWEHQLRFLFEKAFSLDQDKLDEIRAAWNAVVLEPEPTTPTEPTPPPET